MTGRELGDQLADMGTYWDRCPSSGITVAREHFCGMTIRQRMAMAADVPWDVAYNAFMAIDPKRTDKPTNRELIKARAMLQVAQADALLDELAKERTTP